MQDNLEKTIQEYIEQVSSILGQEGSPSLYEVNQVMTLYTRISPSLYLLKKEVLKKKAQAKFEFDIFYSSKYDEARKILSDEKETRREPAQEAIRLKALSLFEDEFRQWDKTISDLKTQEDLLDSYTYYLKDCLSACKSIGDNLRFLGSE